MATSIDLGAVNASGRTHTIVLAYDDVRSVYYFGAEYSGLWRQSYDDIQAAIVAAANEADEVLARSVSHDEALLGALIAAGGVKYAALCALAWRQTLGALKPVWAHDRRANWTFLKEISTNGDMNTMDVIYPASPMLL